MDFEFSDEQLMIRDLARDFAQNEIAPIAAKIDETGEFPFETVKKMGELGLMGLQVSAEYGGAGADAVSYVLALIEIAKVCASHAVIMSVNNSLVCYGLETFCTPEQKEKFLRPLASGQAIGAYSLTEPQSGSDAGNMHTTATRDGDEYVIDGRKSWVSSGPVADFIVTFVSTDRSLGSRGTSAIIVDTSLPGFARGKTEPKLGIRASATCELTFDNYRVPASHLLGKEGQGFKIALTILDAGRIGIAAQAVGIAQAAYEVALRYAQEREAFGSRIADFQAIQHTLVNMSMEIDAARLLVYRAAWLKDQGASVTEAGAKAKLFASEMARRQTAEAIQVLGGYGYTKEFPVERYYRDAKITEIYEGTSEIQRLVIAREILSRQAHAAAV